MSSGQTSKESDVGELVRRNVVRVNGRTITQRKIVKVEPRRTIVERHPVITSTSSAESQQNIKNPPAIKARAICFWHSDSKIFPPIAIASLQSLIRTGHDVILYTYKDYKGIPKGVEVRDCDEIFPFERMKRNSYFELKTAPNAYTRSADIIRYLLINKHPNDFWIDTDVIAFRNFNDRFNDGNLFIGSEGSFNAINAGFFFDPQRKILPEILDLATKKFEMKGQRWGDIGPALVKEVIDRKGLHKFVAGNRFYCGLRFGVDFFKKNISVRDTLFSLEKDEKVFGVHMWNAVNAAMTNAVSSESAFDYLRHNYCGEGEWTFIVYDDGVEIRRRNPTFNTFFECAAAVKENNADAVIINKRSISDNEIDSFALSVRSANDFICSQGIGYLEGVTLDGKCKCTPQFGWARPLVSCNGVSAVYFPLCAKLNIPKQCSNFDEYISTKISTEASLFLEGDQSERVQNRQIFLHQHGSSS